MSRHLVDPELAIGLEGRHLPPALSSVTIGEYRSKHFAMVAATPKPMTEAMAALRFADRRIPGLDGESEVRILVYAPVKRDTPLPAILHIHGGGFVSGSADMSDPNSRS